MHINMQTTEYFLPLLLYTSIAVDCAENPITHREKCHYSKRAVSDSIFCCDEGNPCQGRVKGVIHQMLLPVWMITLNPLVSAVDRLAAD